MRKAKICCVIASNGRDTLYDVTLPSLMAQILQFDSVTVIFDGKRRKHKKIDYFESKGFQFCESGSSLGGPYAQCIAYRACDENYVTLLDDDDILEKNFVVALHDYINRTYGQCSLIVPKVIKEWIGAPIPSLVKTPNNFVDPELSFVKTDSDSWTPPTCSGLTLSKTAFPALPINGLLRGFNDIQIWRAACDKQGYKIGFCEDAVVRFRQDHTIQRKTSNYKRRKDNLIVAASAGVVFSDEEANGIVTSAIFSEARTKINSTGFWKTCAWAFGTLREEGVDVRSMLTLRFTVQFLLLFYLFVWTRIRLGHL